MLYSNNRNDTRQVYFLAWQKAQNGQALEPLEALVVKTIRLHPEYHSFFSTIDNLDKDFPPELGAANPFMHLGLHIAIAEQLALNQPTGLRGIHEKLLARYQDTHNVEHRMMECLAAVLWTAQRQQTVPDDQQYLECLQRLC